MMKTCTTCQQEQPITAFAKHPHGKFGVRSTCKACQSVRNSTWRATHYVGQSIGRVGRKSGYHRCKNCGEAFPSTDPHIRHCPECLSLATVCQCGCGTVIPVFHETIPAKRSYVAGHEKPLATCRVCGSQWRKTTEKGHVVVCPDCRSRTAICVCGCGSTIPAYRFKDGMPRRFATFQCEAKTPEHSQRTTAMLNEFHADPERKAAWLAKKPFPWGKLKEKIEGGIRTPMEQAIEKALISLGIPYLFEWPLAHRYSVDFLLPDFALAIECDSSWHTASAEVAKRDRIKDQLLAEQGIRVLRLQETDVSDPNLLERLRQELGIMKT